MKSKETSLTGPKSRLNLKHNSKQKSGFAKTQKPNKELLRLSLSIGNFIRYWGFRRIHGAIWAQLYLSNHPLSCTDLTHRLKLSKALISPALEELRMYKLIEETTSPNDKTKLYQATTDLNTVIMHVLKTRESLLLEKVKEDFLAFQKTKNQDAQIHTEHTENLGEMIESAQFMLGLMFQQKNILQLPQELGLTNSFESKERS